MLQIFVFVADITIFCWLTNRANCQDSSCLSFILFARIYFYQGYGGLLSMCTHDSTDWLLPYKLHRKTGRAHTEEVAFIQPSAMDETFHFLSMLAIDSL